LNLRCWGRTKPMRPTSWRAELLARVPGFRQPPRMQLATSVVVSRGVVTTLYLPLKRLLSRVKKTPFAAAKEKTVNKDQVSGKVEQAVGKLEQRNCRQRQTIQSGSCRPSQKVRRRRFGATLKTSSRRSNSRARTHQPARPTRREARSVNRCKTRQKKHQREDRGLRGGVFILMCCTLLEDVRETTPR
jgi:hypothetical protein